MALTDKLTAIADAIRAKDGTTGTMTLAEMPSKIAAIPTGGAPAASVSPKDVNFYDYDGTIVAAYTVAEAQALTALPDGPTHDGLTFQGWNWSLESINALTRPMNVGAMYITDDGKTRLYIHIAAEGRMNVPLYFSQTVANGVTIDWGDGSDTQTLSGTGYVNTRHTYASIGDYVITLDPTDGCTLSLGSDSSSYCVMGSTGDTVGSVYRSMLKKVELGKNITKFDSFVFYSCGALKYITIPSGVTEIGSGVFHNCYSLVFFTIPYGVTSLRTNVFKDCSSLISVSIPDSITDMEGYIFYECYSLDSITMGDSVTTIGVNIFYCCYSLKSIIIPNGVSTIYGSDFNNCFSLSSVEICDGVTTLVYRAFYGCKSLSSVTIPSSVTSIGDEVFYNCYGIAEYHIKPATPPTLSGTSAFKNISSDCIIYVPQGCLEAYQNATNWATYASYMQEEPV